MKHVYEIKMTVELTEQPQYSYRNGVKKMLAEYPYILSNSVIDLFRKVIGNQAKSTYGYNINVIRSEIKRK